MAAIPYSGEDNTAGYYQSSLLPGDTGFLQHTFATNPITTTTTTTEKSLNLGAMDLLGAFGGYINPFACPLAVFETRVLENYWVCCPFWYVNDLIMGVIERECGSAAVGSIDTYREMVVPLMRERCPADKQDAIGCNTFYHLARLILVLLLLLVLLITIWAVVVTVRYKRLRRQIKTDRKKEVKSSSGKFIEVPKSKSRPSFTKPTSLQLELRPLTNGHKNNYNDNNNCPDV